MGEQRSSSKGLKLSLSPELAEQLRHNPQSKAVVVATTTTGPNKNDNDNDDDNKQCLPVLLIDLEQLVGYQPDVSEVEGIRSQLLTAMWTRYHEQEHADEQLHDASSGRPPPDFDVQVGELLESGVATFERSSSSSLSQESLLLLRIPYPPRLQSSLSGCESMLTSTHQVWKPVSTPPRPDLDFCQRLWTALQDCSRNVFWKREMAVELQRLLDDEQDRIDYQEWNDSKRHAKLDHLYTVRETMVHQLEISKTSVDELEEARENRVQEVLQEHRRKLDSGLENFGTTELSFPEEFQLMGLRDEEPDEDGDNDWKLDDDSYGGVSSGSDDDGYSIEEELEDDKEISRLDGYDADYADHVAGDTTEAADEQPLETSVQSVPTTDTINLDTANPATTENDLPVSAKVDETEQTQTLLSQFHRRKERRAKARRQKRRERKEAEKQAKLEKLKELEEQIRAKHTTEELVLAQAMNNALAEKVQKVEELLENLQDEAWEAQELQESEGRATQRESQEPAFSLLDQVLAMILGALPQQKNHSAKEHFQYVQREHTLIVEGWKQHFGRLPPPVGREKSGVSEHDLPAPMEPNATPSEQRQALGITDNADEDWDAVEDWDDLVNTGTRSTPSTTSAPTEIAAPPKETLPSITDSNQHKEEKAKRPQVVGLRPGGRV